MTHRFSLLRGLAILVAVTAVASVSLSIVRPGWVLSSGPVYDRTEHAVGFDWRRYLPPRSSANSNWNRVIAQGAFATFEQLRQEIVKNRINADAAQAFEAIIQNADRRLRIYGALGRLEGEERVEALRDLYREMMLAPSSREVLLPRLHALRAKSLAKARRDALNAGRSLGWGLVNGTYAALIAYEHTGDKRFLGFAADTLAEALRFRDTQTGRLDELRGRVMAGWGGTNINGEARYHTNITLAGRVSFALVWFGYIVKSDPALARQFGTAATSFVAGARESLADYEKEFHLLENAEEGYYARVTDGLAEPLNHMAGAANALLLLARLTGEEKYHRMASQLARYFRRSMWTDERDCLVWRYQPRPDRRRNPEREAIWKAGVTILHPLLAHRMHVVFTGEDLKRIACVFENHVVRRDGRFSMYIDAGFRELEYRGDRGKAYLWLTPLMLLDQYEPRIRRVIDDVIASRPDAGGWLAAPYSLIAYAHRLAVPEAPMDLKESPLACEAVASVARNERCR